MGFFATMTFAKDTVEQEALTHVNEFLTYVETNDRFSFEKELYFFGFSIPAAVLYIDANWMHTSGRWLKKTPKNSLLGHVLNQHKNLFLLSPKARKFIFCQKANNITNACFVVCLYQEGGLLHDSKILGPKIAKVLVFKVNKFDRKRHSEIDLMESSIDGINIPHLLGFRIIPVEEKAAGRMLKGTTLSIPKEKLPLMLKDYTAD